MKNFNFKKRDFASGPHLLGILLILAGVFALVSPMFLKSGVSIERVLAVGIGALIIGLLIVSSYGGTLIDFSQKRFKDYTSIVGYKYGEWMTMPDIVTIKVTSSSYRSTNTSNGISPTLSGKVTDFKIFLYANSPQPIFSFEYSSKRKAVKKAQRLAADLKADLVLNISGQD